MRIRPLHHEERRDWLRLSLSENVGPSTFCRLIARFGSAAAALDALPGLATGGGLNRAIRICPPDRAEAELSKAAELGQRMIASCEPEFPPLLRAIDPPPPLVFAKGLMPLARTRAIAIVGARNASAAGRRLARQVAAELGQSEFIVVSGLARGIDTAAHEAALSTGTIAVMAGGIDHVYPPENEKLHREISEKGLLVSEMTPGTTPKAEHFPRRNRIISGLSLATVVVEAALRSGSLITARCAVEQGREVFAVPGSPLDPRSEGCNRLIRDGAMLLLNARDVIDTIGDLEPRQADAFSEPDAPIDIPAQDDDRARRVLFELLSPAPVDADMLIRESGLAPAVVAGLLLEFELAGRVIRLPRGLYVVAEPD